MNKTVKKETKHGTFRLPIELCEKIEKMAADEGRSFNNMLMVLLSRSVK